jgi:hypothetical protein
MFEAFVDTLERRLLGLLVLVGVVGSLLVSLLGGRPATLPGVALGSTAVLYVEKATACFSSYLLVLVVVVRAFAGDLPSELRGVKYAVESNEGDAGGGMERLSLAEAELRDRIANIERVVAKNAAQ